MIGYTAKQAERLKHSIDRDVAKVEDALAALSHRVPDTGATGFSFATEIEEVHRVAADLKVTVDRRTRKEAAS